MIKLSNGHEFEYMAASGALGFDGRGWPWEQPMRWLGLIDPTLFTVVIKTLTLQPRRGNLRWYNPLCCVRLIDGGIVNAVGLSNPGIEWWCKKVGSSLNFSKIPLVASIFGEPDELVEMAGILNGFDFVGLEINVACPNVNIPDNQQVIASCESVRAISRLPLILKLSPVHDTPSIMKEVDKMVEAISINSVPWSLVFPDRRSPLEKFGGGGVSGKAAQPFSWNLVRKLVDSTAIPVIGPSVWDFDDLKKVRHLGASAVSFGSIFMRYPWRPALYVRKEKESDDCN